MNNSNPSRRINLLRDSVAQRIAAGEVIDRPFSVVRELLDNAVDSGASEIEVYIENGGLDSIRVIDNGAGMSPEDMEVCYLPHSTSKISEIEDLDILTTLGFRGEALASIASCAQLEITSSETGEAANKIRVRDGAHIISSPCTGKKGTLVDVSALFHTMPARKKFLKRPSSEAAACRRMFIEKSLPFHTISFRYFQNRELKLYYPVSSLKERLLTAFPGVLQKDLIHEINAESETFSLRIVAADPSLTRKDRRFIQIFLNNRKISDFSLTQAVEYGFSEFLPGGVYPLAFVFITIDPSLIDFNIHPAKKEVRIRNTAELHHKIVMTLKTHFQNHSYNFSKSAVPSLPEARTFTGLSFPASPNFLNPPSPDRPVPVLAEKQREYKPELKSEPQLPSFRYIGQVFNLFLIVESGTNIFFIDQHASHEKILFNEFIQSDAKVQELLVPIIFTTDDTISSLIKNTIDEYLKMGIVLENIYHGEWALKGLPEKCIGQESVIVDFIKNQKGAVKDLKTALYADMACKSAIKDGETLDSVTAVELIRKTLALENARCPHGRPLWFQVSRDELFTLVGRT